MEKLLWQSLDDHQIVPSSSESFVNSPLIPHAHNYPRYLSKLVQLEVTMNAQDYSNTKHSFLYQKDLKVTRLVVSKGSFTGGTPVFIEGSDFVNSTNLLCRFGHHLENAIFLTRDTLLCFSPPQSHIRQEYLLSINDHMNNTVGDEAGNLEMEDIMKVRVEVSNNGVDFSNFHHMFRFGEPVKAGYYQPGVEEISIRKAPRGSFSYGEGNRNFTLCHPGTYQLHKGFSECYRCPIGFFCSEYGMIVPRLCSAGYDHPDYIYIIYLCISFSFNTLPLFIIF